MNAKDIKPIPKYIERRILKLDSKLYPSPYSFVRFYAYLAIWKKELVKVTVAVKHYRKKRYIKQVAVHGLRSEQCLVKDMEYNYFGTMGFRVGWYEQGLYNYRKWYESDHWASAKDKYYDPYALIINKEIITKLPEFKYSAYELYQGVNLFKYLRLYEKYPQIEYLMKLGLTSIAQSVTVLKKVAKDRQFCKWLIRHKEELKSDYFYVNTVLMAYKTNRDLTEIQKYESWKKCFVKEKSYKPIKELFKGKLLERFFSYISKQDISPRLYLDYLNACNYLNLDMTEDKNRFPHDFKRWHDIRIDEYATAKAEADEKERKELYRQFAVVSEKYLTLQSCKNTGFVVFIAKSPKELIREGELLHHCVGHMGYEQKFIREETLIFFIRNALTPNTPFVTVEYSLKRKQVLQCYGMNNSKPDDTVERFISKTWLPYANKQLKLIAA